MLISKSLLMKNGVTATIWKITQIFIDLQTQLASVSVSPYLSSIEANNGSKAVGPRKVFIIPFNESNLGNISIDDIYQSILDKASEEVPDFSGEGTHIFDPDLADGTLS